MTDSKLDHALYNPVCPIVRKIQYIFLQKYFYKNIYIFTKSPNKYEPQNSSDML